MKMDRIRQQIASELEAAEAEKRAKKDKKRAKKDAKKDAKRKKKDDGRKRDRRFVWFSKLTFCVIY